MPLMVFVVDEDVRIKDLNRTAEAVFGLNKAILLNQRGGEILHCLHAHETAKGCGWTLFCQKCVIRNSVKESLAGQAVIRRRTKVELLHNENTTQQELLITTSPLPNLEGPRVLLIIEDISEISRLKNILPICAKCKKIRDDELYWHNVESYFHEYIGVGFTHGFCPECVRKLRYDRADNEETDGSKGESPDNPG